MAKKLPPDIDPESSAFLIVEAKRKQKVVLISVAVLIVAVGVVVAIVVLGSAGDPGHTAQLQLETDCGRVMPVANGHAKTMEKFAAKPSFHIGDVVELTKIGTGVRVDTADLAAARDAYDKVIKDNAGLLKPHIEGDPEAPTPELTAAAGAASKAWDGAYKALDALCAPVTTEK